MDKVLKTEGTKLIQETNISNTYVDTLSSLPQTCKSFPSPTMYRKPNVFEEKFKMEKKRSSTNSFLLPAKNKILFHSVKTAPTLQNKTN